MLKGKTLFICTKCKHVFIAPDIEYHCTAFSCPQPCTKCGSIRTLPISGMLYYGVYRKMWNEKEKS